MESRDVGKWHKRQLKSTAGFSEAIAIEGEINSIQQIEANQVDNI